MSELADEHDLGSCAARRGGSSPPFPISSSLVAGLGLDQKPSGYDITLHKVTRYEIGIRI